MAASMIHTGDTPIHQISSAETTGTHQFHLLSPAFDASRMVGVRISGERNHTELGR